MSIFQRIQKVTGNLPSPPTSTPVRRRTRAAVAEQYWPSDNLAEGDGFVKRCVTMADIAPETTRAGSETIHVSSVIRGDWCPRAYLIHSRHMQGQSENVLSQQRIVWIIGRAAEHHVRVQFIKMHGRHRVVGNWTCGCGATEVSGPGSLTAVCQTCGGPVADYGELLLIDTDRRLSGNPDLVFITSSGGLEIVEIKSIKKDDFDKLFKANPQHVLQCRSYVRLLKSKFPEKKIGGRVLYVAKDYINPRTSPYLEFELTDAMNENADLILDTLNQSVDTTRAHEEQGTYPDRLPVCASMKSPRAKACTACSLCFSL